MINPSSFRIIGTGANLPDQILTNAEIKATRNSRIDCEWVAEKLGIQERRIADEKVSTSDLAAEAVRSALRQTDINPSSIDLLIVATATGERKAPSTACLTQAKTGLGNAACFDISAVCSGFLYSLTTAAAFITAGLANRAVVVGADIFSRITDWERRDCVFFGDGAGAVIIERSRDPEALFDSVLYADGTKADAFTIHPPHSTFTMDASGVLEAATTAIPRCVAEVTRRNGVSVEDIDVVIPHQPSINLLRKVAWDTGIPFQKFRTNMDRYANTAGATIPILLNETYESGGFKDEDLVMFAAAGAGFTAGAAIYRWH